MNAKPLFYSDYMEGCHPAILARLSETNFAQTDGYGCDSYCDSAKAKIRAACQAPEAEIHFLVGGTQCNATVIKALLRPYQGVLAARSGHIAVHEAGAIELGGHKVLTLPEEDGKIKAADVAEAIAVYKGDANREHTVMPGMVYISHPTEYGTLYSLAELEELSELCRREGLYLYVDGARLAYALACPANDIQLPDLARLCDAFYIGGTKCGALFGEALVLPKAGLIPGLFSIIKQNGALLAKGRLLGVQFDTLFTDDLYFKVGANAQTTADRLRAILVEVGAELCFNSPTNQIFVKVRNEDCPRYEAAGTSFMEKADDAHTILRFVTSWATAMDDVEAVRQILQG